MIRSNERAMQTLHRGPSSLATPAMLSRPFLASCTLGQRLIYSIELQRVSESLGDTIHTHLRHRLASRSR